MADKVQANELRIGNLIDFEGRTCTVEEIDKQGVIVLFEDGETEWIDLFQFFPIHLTPEWLEKFGFYVVLKNSAGQIYNMILDMSVANSALNITIWNSGKIEPATKHIQYVHQLQNLFFALTNKELEVKQ